MTFSECHTSALGDKAVALLSSLWRHELRQGLSAGFTALDIKNRMIYCFGYFKCLLKCNGFMLSEDIYIV